MTVTSTQPAGGRNRLRQAKHVAAAENVRRNFLPSTGRLHRVAWPHTVRVDTGVETGAEISVHYDPMMAKVIAHGADRPAAVVALREALRQTEIVGVEHNVPYLRNVLAHERFLDGTYTTALAEDEADALTPGDEPLSVLAAALALVAGVRDAGPWNTADGFQTNLPREQRFTFRRGRKRLDVDVTHTNDAYHVETPDGDFEARNVVFADEHLHALVGNVRLSAAVHRIGSDVFVVKDGATERLQMRVLGAGDFRSAASAGGKVTAPMPGNVVGVSVAVGDRVKAGQTLVVLEAMKMEHNIAAPGNGKVSAVNVAVGERVEEGAELVVIGR